MASYTPAILIVFIISIACLLLSTLVFIYLYSKSRKSGISPDSPSSSLTSPSIHPVHTPPKPSSGANNAAPPSTVSAASASQVAALKKRTAEYFVPLSELLLGDMLGKGSQGEVFKATWRGSEVAVKKIDTRKVGEDIIEEFCQEAEIMRRLRHPSLTLFMGLSLEHPHLCIVTEIVHRGSLFDILRDDQSGFTWAKALTIAVDITQGMTYLHAHSPPILHRDLKSLNILVDTNWKAKVADFGMTRFQDQDSGTMTQCGSPLWMSPEMIKNEPYDEKADVYSFAIVLWELYTRQVPYRELNLNPSMLVVKVVKESLRPAIPKTCPKPYADLMRSCWMKNPEKRPTFGEILAILEKLVVDPKMKGHKPMGEAQNALDEDIQDGKDGPSSPVDQIKTHGWKIDNKQDVEVVIALDSNMGTANAGGPVSNLSMVPTVFRCRYRGSSVVLHKYKVRLNPNPQLQERELQHIWGIMKSLADIRHPNCVLFMGAYLDTMVQQPVLIKQPSRPTIAGGGAAPSTTPAASPAPSTIPIGNFCVLEEDVPRGNLIDILKDTKIILDWNLLFGLLLDVCRGLLYLHLQHPPIIHEDLRTSRLLISSNWHVKISHYGFIGLEDRLYHRKAPTSLWSAPELFDECPGGATDITPASNVYTLSLIMWHCITRKLPYDGRFGPKLRKKILEGFRLPIPAFVPDKVKLLVKACWQTDPSRRPPLSSVLEQLALIKQEGPPKIRLDVTNATRYHKAKTVYAYQSKDPITFLKDWGKNHGKAGAWLLVTDDDLYMCDDQVFKKTYIKAEKENEYRKVGTVLAKQMADPFSIKTDNGSIEQGGAGDWILQNDSGDQWVVEGKTFGTIYEVEGDEKKETMKVEERKEEKTGVPDSLPVIARVLTSHTSGAGATVGTVERQQSILPGSVDEPSNE